MVSRVTYRPFDENDFNELATILQDTWHTHVPSPGYGFLEACCDLAHSLAISTFSQVALIDEAPRGIVLARPGSRHTIMDERWHRAWADYCHQMQLAEPQAAAAYDSTVKMMDRTNARLLQSSGLAGSTEITLLAVDKTARGLGIGGVLLDAVTTYLASHGADRAFMYTDTDCTWPFYEHHGFKRAGSYRAKREERKLIPKEMYIYGLDLSA